MLHIQKIKIKAKEICILYKRDRRCVTATWKVDDSYVYGHNIVHDYMKLFLEIILVYWKINNKQYIIS